ncbi:MAG TPA: fatty acid desaturase, partial [Stenomitos sp.]
EGEEHPDSARLRARKISVGYVFVMGAASLGLQRKLHGAFFPFRPKFRWPVPNREALIRSVRVTNLGHGALHLALIAFLGLGTWAGLIVPAYFCAAGLGALLFWVQHNFERTYHAEEEAWSFVEAGLYGASYLRLKGFWDWATASIGIHHVHHLNVLIPNYRLEEARSSVPEIAAIAPLSGVDLRQCFTHVFWDGEQRRMVPLEELRLDGTSRA